MTLHERLASLRVQKALTLQNIVEEVRSTAPSHLGRALATSPSNHPTTGGGVMSITGLNFGSSDPSSTVWTSPLLSLCALMSIWVRLTHSNQTMPSAHCHPSSALTIIIHCHSELTIMVAVGRSW